jgi:hypothetical protein
MESSLSIDRKSFFPGMLTAFAECIANESKKAAEKVRPEIREGRSTIDTSATVLLKPKDWPMES